MTPAEWAVVASIIEALTQLVPEAKQAVDDFIHAKGDEQRQVYLARLAANASVDAYERIRNVLGK